MDFLGLDLKPYVPVFALVGVIGIILGLIIRKASSEDNGGVRLISYFFGFIGLVCLAIALFNWIGDAIESWQNNSEYF